MWAEAVRRSSARAPAEAAQVTRVALLPHRLQFVHGGIQQPLILGVRRIQRLQHLVFPEGLFAHGPALCPVPTGPQGFAEKPVRFHQVALRFDVARIRRRQPAVNAQRGPMAVDGRFPLQIQRLGRTVVIPGIPRFRWRPASFGADSATWRKISRLRRCRSNASTARERSPEEAANACSA